MAHINNSLLRPILLNDTCPGGDAMNQTLDYFAYGSNMHLLRLRERTPSCVALEVVELASYRLRFHKRNPDGSGKCNVFFTGQQTDRVFGVLYRIDMDEKPLLDRAEGVGHGYRADCVEVRVGDSQRRVHTYFADPDYIDDALKPYRWYKELVIAGARMHELPSAYIDQIERQEALEDPDISRAERHWRIIRRQHG